MKIVRLNRLSVRTNVGPIVRFWHYRYKLTVLLWHPVTSFFQLASKWSKWCAQTLHPFSQILTISSHIGAPIVAPPSDNFENCSILWKALFFRKKTLKYRLNRPTNTDAMSCGSNTTTHQSSRRPTSVIFKKQKTVKDITFHTLAPTCVARFPRNFAW